MTSAFPFIRENRISSEVHEELNKNTKSKKRNPFWQVFEKT